MGFWNQNYDFANGAPFGDFDFDNDNELDIVEKTAKLEHYSTLWEEEDSIAGCGGSGDLDYLLDEDDDDDF